MSQEATADNWLMKQVSVSARRLAETPPILLDPVGRSLQEIAKRWNTAASELRVVPEANGVKRKASSKRKTSGRNDPRQSPLLGVIEGIEG